jgi:tRNA-Thr(GGU) m(6)t(6)A37 methyltransferase TsaA
MITLTPIGYVIREGEADGLSIPALQAQRTQVAIAPQYVDGLLGIEAGSDLVVLYHFDRASDDVLQVHPRGDRSRPLRGVFATRSPARPNRIAVTTVRVLKVTENVLDVVGLDALDGSPVLDIKSYAPTFAQPYEGQPTTS